jgi:hypothetical protein
VFVEKSPQLIVSIEDEQAAATSESAYYKAYKHSGATYRPSEEGQCEIRDE